MTTTTTTDARSDANAECKRALLQSMYAWAFNREAQADVCIEVGRARGVPDWLMARVHGRRNWYVDSAQDATILGGRAGCRA